MSVESARATGSRQPTRQDRRLKAIASGTFLVSQVLNLLGQLTGSGVIVVGMALPLFVVAVVLGLRVLWLWYDRQPDGRRGE